MEKKQTLCILMMLLIILLIPNIQAARVYGNIYNFELELLKNTIVSVNSTPKQTLVAADGAYSFELAPGTYIIEAYNPKNFLYSKEEINIITEGSYILDLVLFETQEFNDFEFNESELLTIEDFFQETKKNFLKIIIVVLIVLVIITLIVVIFYRKNKKLKKEKTEINEISHDETLNKIINFIKKEKRLTQKELRKKFEISEAKTSLFLADLEDRGIIKKIKKGRGNIIIYKNK